MIGVALAVGVLLRHVRALASVSLSSLVESLQLILCCDSDVGLSGSVTVPLLTSPHRRFQRLKTEDGHRRYVEFRNRRAE